MNSKERIELFLKYQNEKMSFEDISKKLEIKPDTLRRTLNKNGYKSNKGIYEKKVDDSQLSFSVLNTTNNSENEPDDTTSSDTTSDSEQPKTGDSSNWFLWAVLLLVSSCGMIGTAVYGKKKKMN